MSITAKDIVYRQVKCVSNLELSTRETAHADGSCT